MVKSFVPKVIGIALVVAGLVFLFPATASAQTASTKELPPQAANDLRNALELLSITLGVLEVRMEQQDMILAGTGQQLGVVASQIKVLQNPSLMDTENERKIVSQILSVDAQLVGLMKTQVEVVKQDQARQISAISGLTSAFKSLTELIVKWKTSA